MGFLQYASRACVIFAVGQTQPCGHKSLEVRGGVAGRAEESHSLFFVSLPLVEGSKL